MKLRYSRPFTLALLGVGVLLFAVSLATGQILSIFTGAVLALLGVLLTRTPIAVIQDGELQRKNALGMTLKRFPVAGPADLRVDGKKVVHVATGKTATSLGFGTDPTDAAAWREWIGS